jgi:hypothetical protein
MYQQQPIPNPPPSNQPTQKVQPFGNQPTQKYETVLEGQEVYRVTEGVKTQEGIVEKSYTIPSDFATIEEVVRGIEKNYLRKSDNVVDPEVIGQFFKSLEANSEKNNIENVKITDVSNNE